MSQVGWATDLVFDSLGTVIQVRSTDPVLGEMIGRLKQHFPKTDAPTEHLFSVTHDGSVYSVTHNGKKRSGQSGFAPIRRRISKHPPYPNSRLEDAIRETR